MNLLKVITPINLEEEKVKFFKDSSYHPQFKYNWENININPQTKYLKQQLALAVLKQDHESIVATAKKYFKINNWEYFKLAQKITKSTPETVDSQDPDKCKTAFEESFKFLELDDYRLEIVDKHGFNFRPNQESKTIFMSKYMNFQFFDIEGEVRHELVHIIRYENGKFNQIKKTPGYLPTEEGLATYMQDTSVNGKSSEFQHAAEYIASKIGTEGSLQDIYEFFISIRFTQELAWQRASRHKFGFKNTSQPGDIIKPAMYFANSQKIKQLDNDSILRLFTGKITIEKLENHPNYKGIIKEDKLREFYSLF